VGDRDGKSNIGKTWEEKSRVENGAVGWWGMKMGGGEQRSGLWDRGGEGDDKGEEERGEGARGGTG